MVKIQISYSNNNYDEIVGYLLEDCDGYNKGDMVYVFLDYDSNDLKINNELLTISKDNILKITDIESCILLLPVIKYGTIILNIIEELKLTIDSHIEIKCPYNIYHLFNKFLKCKHLNWVSEKDIIKCSDVTIIIKGDIVIASNQNTIITHNLADVSFIKTYGIETIKKMIDYSLENNIYADVSYIYYKCIRSNLHENKSRFFNIIYYDNI